MRRSETADVARYQRNYASRPNQAPNRDSHILSGNAFREYWSECDLHERRMAVFSLCAFVFGLTGKLLGWW